MRLAWYCQLDSVAKFRGTYIFDLGAWMNSDDVAMLDTKVVADYSIHARASVVKVVIGQNDQDGILPLLAFD